LISNSTINILNSIINITSSSTIISKDCINLSNTTLIVDLSNATNLKNLLLLNSTSGCLKLSSFSISYLNEPKCVTLQEEEDNYSFSIIFKQSNSDCMKDMGVAPSIQEWIIILIIIVASIIGIALIFIVLALSIRPLRILIFPKRNPRDKIKTKIESNL